MDVRTELRRSYSLLLNANTVEEKSAAANSLRIAIDQFEKSKNIVERPDVGAALQSDDEFLQVVDTQLETISDGEIDKFNQLLPWGAMTIDRRGRIVGSAWNSHKRNIVNSLVDPRIRDFDRAFPLSDKHTLEIGCFEGIHTLGCSLLGAKVTGVDGRIENILKTMARLWLYGHYAPLILWNVEHTPPSNLPRDWDVLHHVGVLYHLKNPVQHLIDVLPRTRKALMLDTHVARDLAATTGSYAVAGREYRFSVYDENQRDVSPFSGLEDHAKWLLVDDLISILHDHGFTKTQIKRDDDERNGRRVLIWAFRSD